MRLFGGPPPVSPAESTDASVGHSRSVVVDRHSAKLQRVADRLSRRPAGVPMSFKKSSVSHEVPRPRDARHRDEKVDVSDLDEILEIDVEGMTCTAEPGVTFTKLVRATLRHGLVPIIVPELRTITVGGAVSAMAGSTTRAWSTRS
jgi:FAD binding domain